MKLLRMQYLDMKVQMRDKEVKDLLWDKVDVLPKDQVLLLYDGSKIKHLGGGVWSIWSYSRNEFRDLIVFLRVYKNLME